MRPRTIIIEGDPTIRKMLTLTLEPRGHDVQAFPAPDFCPLFWQDHCSCPQQDPCGDILIASLNLPPVGGLEFLRRQQKKGCKGVMKNKLIFAEELTDAQFKEAKELGCKIMSKPFQMTNFLKWVRDCEETIDVRRRLGELRTQL